MPHLQHRNPDTHRRIRSGELVVRYGDVLVQKLETRMVHHPRPAPPPHLRVAAVRRDSA